MRRTQARWQMQAAIAVLTVAALLVILPLVFRVPWKAADAQEVLDALHPGEALVARTEDAYATSQAGFREVEERLIPDVAASLGVSRAQLDAVLAVQFPDVARGLEAMPSVLGRYEARVAIRRDGNEDLETLKKIPLAELGWFGPAFGAAVAAPAG